MSTMETFFANAERSDAHLLANEIEIVTGHPIVNEVLLLVQGMVAVLNKHRQILSVNPHLIKDFEIDNVSTILGLRPGEVLGCVHADEMPGKCGTSRSCSSCGAAIAIVTAQVKNTPVSRTCSIEAMSDGVKRDFFFDIHAVPISIENDQYIVLFLRDISEDHQRAAVEQIFLHDINNILACTISIASILEMDTEGENQKLARQMIRDSKRIASEISMQRCLTQNNSQAYSPVFEPVSLPDIFDEIIRTFKHHPAASEKRIATPDKIAQITLETDRTLLLRVLTNMLVNAYEATIKGGEIVFDFEEKADQVVFKVWNAAVIPDNIIARIFQRNFSTKTQIGHGLGTYSMKLFGEKLLGGKVTFSTSQKEGTEFCFSIGFSNASMSRRIYS